MASAVQRIAEGRPSKGAANPPPIGLHWGSLRQQKPGFMFLPAGKRGPLEESLSLAEQQVPLAFTVAIAPEAPTEEDLVKYLSLSVENPAPWTIISTDTTTLAVDTFRITGTLFSPFVAAARYFTIALMAEVQLGEGTFRFSFDPAQETVFLSECSGRVTLENLVSLLMGGGEVDVPDIAITDFSLAIDAKNSFYKGSLILNSDWNFQLGDVTFGIQNLVAKMSYNTVLGSRFFLYGSMDFSGIIDEKSEDGSENSSELIMMAAYPGQQAGWTFMGKGKSGCDTIGDIVDQVVELFGGVPDPLPAVIQNLAVTEVEVRFNTKTRAAAFIVEAAWLSEEDVSSATVRLEIKNRVQAAGTSQVIFSGQLVFDDDEGNAEFEFDLIFETAGDQDLFLAYYQSDEASQTTLSNLVSQITGQSPDDPSGASLVEISLLEGLFCYDNRSGNGKELFCVGLGAALDLSELGELPIIGPLFDDAPDLDIVTQLLYATGAENSSGIVFTQPEVALLNRLLMGKKVQFPQADENGIPAGLSTAMLIRLGGGKPIPVDLYPPTATGLPPNVSGMPRPESITPRSQERISWFRIQKTFGPINISRVGLGFSENGITGYLDANLNADVFQAGLIELYVTFELRDTGFDNIEFGLNGLSLEFQIEPLSIGGTFLKSESSDSSAIQYDGFASIQTGPLMLSALGSYTSDETGHPSLFLFAVADFPLGGPGFCFLTGFCAGFGFNRDLILPPVSGVPTYWMIQEATKPRGNFYGGSTRRLNSIALSANRYCPAATGQYWLAAGVSFTSYEIVNSLAVLSVGVGNGSLEFDVIGMSTILVPPTPGENFTPIGQAQLALEGSFTLQEDPFSADIVIQGQLTQNSYIFSRSCRLTGGFALAFWVGGNQGGDFVATFGGYHPDFKPPSYYPRVPRVGFHWMIGRLLNAKGNMYFALTPHAIMAGGLLELLCQISASGPVPSFRASFELSVDFLLNWKPYHYQAETVAEVDISVVFKSFGTHTISASAGADLDLWGPDFGGTAELHMSILFIKINFDVSFGAANEPPQPSSFGDFQNSFLPPQEEPPNSVNLPQTTTPAPTAEQDASSSGNAHWNYISAIVTSGLSRQIQVSQDGETRNYSIVNAKHLAITTSSVIPVTQFESWTEVDLSSFQTGGLGIAPMNQTIDSASHTLSVERRTDSGDDAGTFTDTSSQFAPPQPYPKAVPTAMWNTQMLDTSDPASVNAQQLFKNTVGGALIQPQSPVAPGESRAFPRKRFRYDTTDLAEAFAWERTGRFLVDTENNPAPDDLDANVKALHSLQETLNSGPVVAARNQLLATLGFVTNKVNLNQPILEYTTLAPRYGTFESLESKPT